MEHKLYYQDAYKKTFTSRPLKQQQDGKGSWFVVLKETAFYPTGGGQPHDTGTIDGIKVINVEEQDGEIRHFLEEPLANPNTDVSCAINWERRFDHMQQHSGSAGVPCLGK